MSVMDRWCLDVVGWSKMRYSVCVSRYTVTRKVVPVMVYYNEIKISALDDILLLLFSVYYCNGSPVGLTNNSVFPYSSNQ
jgi:hypothetical protein